MAPGRSNVGGIASRLLGLDGVVEVVKAISTLRAGVPSGRHRNQKIATMPCDCFLHF